MDTVSTPVKIVFDKYEDFPSKIPKLRSSGPVAVAVALESPAKNYLKKK